MKKTIVSLLLIVTMLLTVIPPAMAEPDDAPPTPGAGETSTSQEGPSDPDSSAEPEATAESVPEATPAADTPEATPAADIPEATPMETAEATPEATPEETPGDDDPLEGEDDTEEDEDLIQIGEFYTLTADSDIFSGNNDALLTGYVEQLFRCGDPNTITFPKNKSLPDPHEVLNDQQYAVEQSLKSTIQAIARGSRYETQIDIVLSHLNLTYDTARRIDMEQVFHTLLLDCTYELYWFGRQISWGFTSEAKMTVCFYVAEDYAADDTRLKVKRSAISAAVEAVKKTSSIITSAAALSDVEKLRAYKNEICRLTSYNEDAAYTDTYDGQEGPWSLVWVFDGDPATNVVCEGYAKAFEYLCNHSSFRSNLINCYCVSGPAVFSNGASGPHMWNIVTMDDGRNYVIDVTNSDTGDTGDNVFFLCYGLDGSPQEGYLLSCVAMYLYDDTSLNACSDRARTLASTPYQGTPGDVKITQQPQDQRIIEGQEATFTVAATGSGLTYQWYCLPPTDYTWQTMYGETEPTLTVTAQADMDETFYYCLVTGSSGRRPSESALLEVVVPPEIVKQPEDSVTTTNVEVSLQASGTYLRYQWYLKARPTSEWEEQVIPSTDITKTGQGPLYQFTIYEADVEEVQLYCVVSNEAGSVTSNIVTITVVHKPFLRKGATDVAVLPGETATFTVVLAHGNLVDFQWYTLDGMTKIPIPSATSDSYSVIAEASMDGQEYWCVVSNIAGEVSCRHAHLYVITAPPVITAQPVDCFVSQTALPTLSVEAEGRGLTYQWYCFDGENEYAIEGATEYILTLRSGHQGGVSGQYWCVVSNALGSVTSDRATVTYAVQPVITVQPQDVTAIAGETVTFTITATGNGLYYRWYVFDGQSSTLIDNANGTSYSFTASIEQNGYKYYCLVSNPEDLVYSRWAKLTVLPADATPTPYTPPSGENVIRFGPDDLPTGQTVEVDGVSYPLGEDGTVLLPDGVQAHIVTEYTYNKVSQDPHEVYPTAMRVWRVTVTNDEQVAQRVPELDDVLQYSGSSIRITGNKGIRMITSVPKDKKKSLTSKNGLSGWTLLEYGTVVAWDSELNGDSLTLEHPAAKRAYAYKKGSADPIFKDTGKLIQYTNVLVGMTNEKCVPDLAMRPYMILESPAKVQVKLYGGTIHRSIGYIAYQNRKAFQPGTASYKFIWDIIHFVYGDAYDADYKK